MKEPLVKKNIPQKAVDPLTSEIIELTKHVRRSNSLFRALLKGIMVGIGTALGATVIAGLALWLLWSTIQELGLDKYFNTDALQQIQQLRSYADQFQGEVDLGTPQP